MATPTSVRLDEQEMAQLEKIAARWGASASDAVRRLVRATAKSEVLDQIEWSTWPAGPPDPKAKRFRVGRDWNGMLPTFSHPTMGSTAPCEVHLKAGSIVARDDQLPPLPETLHQRGCLLEPVPD